MKRKISLLLGIVVFIIVVISSKQVQFPKGSYILSMQQKFTHFLKEITNKKQDLLW